MLSDIRWRYATRATIILWSALAVRLMIADVWDETNGMLFFCNPARPLGEIVTFILTKSFGFWRPLSTLIAGVVAHLTGFELSWHVLRGIDIVFVIGALALLFNALQRWRGDVTAGERFVITIAVLFSGSAIITAGWYANIFDASTLLFLAAGLALLARQRPLAAGVLFGIAFYCKETAALILPFLGILWIARRINLRDALRAGIPATLLGAVYFIIRSRLISFGGEGDVHGFDPQYYGPSLLHLVASFWLQILKIGSPLLMIAGIAATIVSLAALRKPLLIGSVVVFLLVTSVVYWGMFYRLQELLIEPRNFTGRLYLVPVTLVIFLLALERRTWVIALLCLPIVYGGAITYRDHARFQRTYKQIYKMAHEATVKPLRVGYAVKPLDDSVRGIIVGDFPDAPVSIDPRNGRLRFATPAQLPP